MNADTLVTLCCRAEDEALLLRHMPFYRHHDCPILVISSIDSCLVVPGCLNVSTGYTSYIGHLCLTRTRRQLEYLLTQPQNYHLIFDADSFCLSPAIPSQLYQSGVVWSTEVVEPRPHASPYPKLAFQAPYFLHRDTIRALLSVAPYIAEHPITPYTDWFMVAMTYEAQLKHHALPSNIFFHPIKTEQQLVDARKSYENSLLI